MHRLGLALTFGILVAGTAAQAQVTDVTGTSHASVSLDGTQQFDAPGTFSQGKNGSTVSPSFDLSNPASISFDSGIASSGGFLSSTSTSTVNITIKNGGSSAVAPVLQSQITAAGLGFYVANQAGGCGGNVFTGCPQTTGGQTFADLSPNSTTPGTLVALAGFEFKVSSGASTFMDFTGVETLTVGADGKIMTNDLVLSSLGVLQGLTKLTPGDPGSALGYAWDASDVLIGLGSDLAAGDSRVITYSSTVSTFSRADCSLADESICLVAYSAFGDPVGRGGGVNDASFGGFGASLLGAFSPFGASPGITGVGFTPTTFATPTFENGLLTFNTNGAGVPEPATWMSLIAGFGLLGAALRRRRVVAYN